MPSFEALRAWLCAVELAHHIPGRIRLKLGASPDLDPVRVEASRARAAQAVIEKSRGIRSLRVNLLARSCTVEYDPMVIPPAAWTDYLAGRHSTESQVLDGLLRQAYEEIAHA